MSATTEADLRRLIRDVPDFPRKGIVFKDIAPLLGDAGAFAFAIERMGALAARPDAVVAIESRGFIFGAGLALKWGVRFVPARKFGKLPGATLREKYSLEYGEDVLEIQADALSRGQRVAIVDDLLATGGTAAATAALVERQGATVEALLFLVELEGLGGRERLEGHPVHSVVRYPLG
jgi:adenine phosphoribosyltransferase